MQSSGQGPGQPSTALFGGSSALLRGRENWQQALSLHHGTPATSMLLQRTRPVLLLLQIGGCKNKQLELLLSQVNQIRRINVGLDFYIHLKREQKHQTLEQEEGSSPAVCYRKKYRERTREVPQILSGEVILCLTVSNSAPLWQKSWKANAEWHTSNRVVSFDVLMHAIEDLPFMTFASSTGSSPDSEKK